MFARLSSSRWGGGYSRNGRIALAKVGRPQHHARRPHCRARSGGESYEAASTSHVLWARVCDWDRGLHDLSAANASAEKRRADRFGLRGDGLGELGRRIVAERRFGHGRRDGSRRNAMFRRRRTRQKHERGLWSHRPRVRRDLPRSDQARHDRRGRGYDSRRHCCMESRRRFPRRRSSRDDVRLRPNSLAPLACDHDGWDPRVRSETSRCVSDDGHGICAIRKRKALAGRFDCDRTR